MSSSEVEALLQQNHSIRETERKLSVARTRRKWSNLSLAFGPVLGLLMYAMYWIPVLSIRAKEAIAIPAIPTAVGFFIASVSLKVRPGYPEPRVMGQDRKFTKEGDLEVTLARLREQRKEMLANISTSTKVRRIIYKEQASADIEQLRSESNSYRRVNNFLQGILIIGSLAATGSAGVASQVQDIRWAVMGVTFAVGISSGFMGYFKYKERSFYLQQTADAIEQEWEAVEIGVGRYKKCKSDDEALADFAEEVHRLKSEQKKRQQNLEQPPDVRGSNE